jgi:hypothetical protein
VLATNFVGGGLVRPSRDGLSRVRADGTELDAGRSNLTSPCPRGLCLAKVPDHRYQTAKDLAQSARAALTTPVLQTISRTSLLTTQAASEDSGR